MMVGVILEKRHSLLMNNVIVGWSRSSLTRGIQIV